MKHLVIICLLMLAARSISGQETLQFSADTVVSSACDGFVLVGIIDVYNTSDEDIRVRWKRQRLDFPNGGTEFMIAAGIQYLPGTPAHAFNLYGLDSTEIYFNLFLDTLAPGDSVIWQVLFYDENDSIGTNKLLTAILECPLSSDVEEIDVSPSVSISPNPFNSYTIVSHQGSTIDHVKIFDLSGRLVHSIPVSGDQIILTRENLMEGIYIACYYFQGEIAGYSKLMVAD